MTRPRRPGRPVDHREVEGAAADALDEGAAVAIGQRQLDLWVGRREASEDGRDYAHRQGRQDARRDAARHGLGQARHGRPGLGDIPLDRVDQSVQRPAGGCRHHGLRLAVKQALAEFPFQLGDLHAERGLDDVHPLRGAGDAALLEQGDEVRDLTEIHTRDPGDTSNAPEDHVRAGRRNSNRLMGGITNRYFSRLREGLNASSPGKLG